MQAPAVAPVSQPFAESTPLGLFGLAIGCAALLPIVFGLAVSEFAFKTAAMFCLLFGAGGQFLAGMMALANKNMLGGTLFTTFSFNWIFNWWVLSWAAAGKAANPAVILAVDIVFLVIFIPLTYAFGHYSKLLFVFLLDIDVLYVARILKEVTHVQAFHHLIAAATVLLIVIALWIAFALVLNPIAGRAVIPMPGPLFKPASSHAPAPAA